MKISTFLATSLGVFLLAGAANAATVKYVARLTGAQSQNATFTSTATAARPTRSTRMADSGWSPIVICLTRRRSRGVSVR